MISLIFIHLLLKLISCNSEFGDVTALNANISLGGNAILSWSFLEINTITFMIIY